MERSMVSLCGTKHNAEMELMKKSLWMLLLGGALLATGCKKEDDDTADPVTPTGPNNFSVAANNNVNTVEGTSDVDYTFTADKVWILKGFVYVDGGATLTIEPGTIIKGDKDTKGTLIIRRGAKIQAVGSSS